MPDTYGNRNAIPILTFGSVPRKERCGCLVNHGLDTGSMLESVVELPGEAIVSKAQGLEEERSVDGMQVRRESKVRR
jgi:hypothetical protein